MRIVYDLRYASDHFPGIGTHAHELLSALLGLDADERWFVLTNPRLPNLRFELDRLLSHPRVKWLEFDSAPLAIDTAARTGARLRDLEADVYFSPFWLMPDRPGMPVVLTLHDVLPLATLPGIPLWRRWLFRMAVDRAARADAVLTSSRFSRQEIARHTRIRAERVHVIPLGVPTAQEAPSRPACVPDQPFALVVGTNRPHKNLVVLARAWRRLGGTPPLALVAAGQPDPRFPDLPSLSRGDPHVVGLGRVSTPELEWLYAHATLVLFPTRYEGFGFPLLEALSRGVPAIVSDLPVLREVGESAARFVASDDPAAWADAVIALAADGGERERMARAGRTAAARFDYARCAEATLAVMRRVARSPGP